MRDDTICALSSAPGKAGVAVLRISGPRARDVLRDLAGLDAPVPRRATLADLSSRKDGAILDKGLAVWFPAPASFTGEDVAELHIHGGRATVEAVLDALVGELGLRHAEPGEFTRRAFENGKMDLTEVEGLADLIDAETEVQRQQALRQYDGALGRLYDGWRKDLIGALAYLEAHIDFPDEELPEDLFEEVRARVGRLDQALRDHLADNRRGERLRDGIGIAILGPPNVGKSSLLNAIARREAAIVSATAGTTRDVIEVHLDLGGYPVTVADTAGIRESVDEVEREGVRRALDRAERADLKLIMVDSSSREPLDGQTMELLDESALIVANKSDLAAAPEHLAEYSGPVYAVSAKTGDGIGELLAELERRVAGLFDERPGPVLTRSRHRAAVAETVEFLRNAGERAGQGVGAGASIELIAEDLRLGARALGRLTGRVEVEDLLDVIFRDFCIGK